MRHRIVGLGAFAVAAAVLTNSGCFSRGPSRVHPPSISASGAGSGAMEQYDANKDGAVKADELEKAPSLKASLKQLDKNNDGGVSADEVASRVKAWQDSKVGKMAVSCTVTLNGKPLEGAAVTFDPEKFLGAEIKPCSGTTGPNGMASLSVPIAPGSDEPGGAACGLYLVRVSKKEGGRELIPAKYNTETILGKEIALDAPEMQEGTLHVDLKVP
jgi:hypothetical protein